MEALNESEDVSADEEQSPAAVAAKLIDTAENLTIAHVASVCDNNAALAVAALRTALATALPHHLTPAVPPLVIAGPFGIGKRQLMQRMLTLYPDGFQMPNIYTSNPTATGGQLRVVEPAVLTRLRDKGLVAFEEQAVGETYCVSLEDIAKCAPMVTL